MAAVTKHALRAAGLPILDNPPHIVGHDWRCEPLQGGKQSPVGPAQHLHPTDQLPDVPIGTERLRITPTPRHSEAHILQSGRGARRRMETSSAPLSRRRRSSAELSQAKPPECIGPETEGRRRSPPKVGGEDHHIDVFSHSG
jgi:5-aminolevulinate synthase